MANAEAGVRRGVRRWAVKQVIATTLFGAVASLCAGRIDWPGGWLVVGILTAYFVITVAFLLPRNPSLYAERSGLGKGTKPWDVAIGLLVAYTPLFLCAAAGLDTRFRWAAPMAIGLRIALSALVLPGLTLLSSAMMSNPFFSGTVRIQEERGQTVASGGPYRVVRHPGYVGGILFYAGLTGALGSLWGLLILGACFLLIVLRTALEDATLRKELPGYEAYCRRTRFRLVPGIW